MKSYVQNLYQDLLNTINNNPLSVDIKFFIIKDIYRLVEEAYIGYLNTPDEIQQAKQEMEQIKKQEDKSIPLDYNVKIDDSLKEIIDLGTEKKKELLNKENKE